MLADPEGSILAEYINEGTLSTESGSWMVEGIPQVPYGGLVRHVTQVEQSMRLRRKHLLEILDDDEIAPTVQSCSSACFFYLA